MSSKRGADLHGLTRNDFNQYRALKQVAREAGQWVGEQEVLRSRLKWNDLPPLPIHEQSQAIENPTCDVPTQVDFAFRGAVPLQEWQEEETTEFAASPARFGYNILTADVIRPSSGKATKPKISGMICCIRCGAYSHERATGLLSSCDDNQRKAGLRMQRTRIQQGKYRATHDRYA